MQPSGNRKPKNQMMNTNPQQRAALLALLLFLGVNACTHAQQFPTDTGRRCFGGSFDNGNECKRCPPNTISESGSFVCEPCPKGSFPNLHQDTCITTCPPGSSLQQGRCAICDHGTYASVVNSPICTRCPPGQTTFTYASTRKSGCFGCPKGSYVFAASAGDECYPCNKGYYRNDTTTSQCTQCPPGTTTKGDGAARISKCIPCLPGTFSEGEATLQASCYNCPVGTFASSEGTIKCSQCAPGTRSTDNGRQCVVDCDQTDPVCQKRGCPPGTQAFNGDVKDYRPCPAGTVNELYSTTPCIPCPRTKVPSAKNDACVCAGAKVILNPSDTTCSKCSVGARKVDNTTCKCRKGFTQREYECFCPLLTKRVANQCVKCSPQDLKDAETTTGLRGSTDCTLCMPGEFYKAKKNKCKKCRPGTTNLVQNLLPKCKPCEITHVDSNGATQCGCAPGSIEKKGECMKCPKGKRQLLDRCLDCGFETYGDVAGLTECKQCPEGRRYSAKSKQTSCPPRCPKNSKANHSYGKCGCDAGFINSGMGNPQVCERCPGLQISRNFRFSPDQCICPPGMGMQENTCVECRPGTWSSGFSQCFPCNENTVAPKAGSETCTSCDTKNGFFSIRKGGKRCIKCDEGSFITKKGKCSKCEPGFRLRNRECVKCVDSVSEGGLVAFCTPCQEGKVPGADGRSCVATNV